MPSDFMCKPCGYTLTVGWYHYHAEKDGYVARTMFACGGCGITHFIEHASPASGHYDRLLYLHQRRLLAKDQPLSRSPGAAQVSDDRYTSFDDFKCPSCGSQGKVITAQSVKEAMPECPLCAQPLEFITIWQT